MPSLARVGCVHDRSAIFFCRTIAQLVGNYWSAALLDPGFIAPGDGDDDNNDDNDEVDDDEAQTDKEKEVHTRTSTRTGGSVRERQRVHGANWWGHTHNAPLKRSDPACA
jgi:hypothetical protein